jgi:hypothetical protein
MSKIGSANTYTKILKELNNLVTSVINHHLIDRWFKNYPVQI